MTTETFTNKDLTLEVQDDGAVISIFWYGKSTARDPGQFIGPILMTALKRSSTDSRDITMDFRKIEYMNSSTITPIIRILDAARRGQTSVKILYQKALKWQELSFSALEIFQTPDKRIEIQGVS